MVVAKMRVYFNEGRFLDYRILGPCKRLSRLWRCCQKLQGFGGKQMLLWIACWQSLGLGLRSPAKRVLLTWPFRDYRQPQILPPERLQPLTSTRNSASTKFRLELLCIELFNADPRLCFACWCCVGDSRYGRHYGLGGSTIRDWGYFFGIKKKPTIKLSRLTAFSQYFIRSK